MKKLLVLLAATVALVGCQKVTRPSEDMQMLQSKYSTVYRVDSYQYIVCDSVHVYDVRITNDGQIYSTVKIK